MIAVKFLHSVPVISRFVVRKAGFSNQASSVQCCTCLWFCHW